MGIFDNRKRSLENNNTVRKSATTWEFFLNGIDLEVTDQKRLKVEFQANGVTKECYISGYYLSLETGKNLTNNNLTSDGAESIDKLYLVTKANFTTYFLESKNYTLSNFIIRYYLANGVNFTSIEIAKAVISTIEATDEAVIVSFITEKLNCKYRDINAEGKPMGINASTVQASSIINNS